VDDKGASRGSSGGSEGSVIFKDGIAFAPTDAIIEPGKTKLFTIKATVSTNSAYIGGQLKIDVTSIDTTASQKGNFPIAGTTWTITN